MSKNNVTFNVGGTKFEISKDLIQKYPNSELSSLSLSKKEIFIDHNPLAFGVILDYLRYGKLFVPNNVAKEVIELQLREFRIPYDEILAGFGTKNEDDNLPCYEAAISEFAVPYRGYQDSLKDTAINTAIKRLETLIQGVIIPHLRRHAKRGHQQVTLYLTPNVVDPKNITTDLDHLTDPHEWIYLPYSSQSHSTSSSPFFDSDRKEETRNSNEDLPDIQFLLQSNNLNKLQTFILTKSGVKKVLIEQVEVGCRIENEFGLFSSKSFELIQIDVIIV